MDRFFFENENVKEPNVDKITANYDCHDLDHRETVCFCAFVAVNVEYIFNGNER